MDGLYDCIGGGACFETSKADTAVPSNIIKLPDWQDIRAWHLKSAIVEAVAEVDSEVVCRMKPLGSSRRIDIDDFAAIIMPIGSRDLLFLLRMKCGPRILLSTDDMDMMVDFVRQYVWARVGQDPVLQGLMGRDAPCEASTLAGLRALLGRRRATESAVGGFPPSPAVTSASKRGFGVAKPRELSPFGRRASPLVNKHNDKVAICAVYVGVRPGSPVLRPHSGGAANDCHPATNSRNELE